MFKKFFRNQTKKIINKLGYNISRIDHKFENIDLDHLLSQKINIINPIVFDVGGNVGQSISKFKAIFKDPIVHSFEPNEQTYNLMYTKFREDEKIFCNNFALGDKLENKEFNVTEKTGKSSFYKLNTNDEWKKSRNKRYTTFITSRRVVKISTVDSYCKEMKINEIDLLKMDTQGYEEKILEGATEMLKNSKIKCIIAEIVLNDFYEKNFLFSDLEKHLIPNNFKLVGMEINNNNIFKGAQFGANLYYMSKVFYKI